MRTLWTEYLSQCLGFQLTSGSILSKEKQNDKVIGVSVLSSLDMKPNNASQLLPGQSRQKEGNFTYFSSAQYEGC